LINSKNFFNETARDLPYFLFLLEEECKKRKTRGVCGVGATTTGSQPTLGTNYTN
jgi:hypothetical protein